MDWDLKDPYIIMLYWFQLNPPSPKVNWCTNKSGVKYPSINTCQDTSVVKAWYCKHMKHFSPRVTVSIPVRRNFLPPATKLGQGYVFTRVCDSVHKGDVWWCSSMHCRRYPSMPCSRSWGGGIPACLAGFQAHTQGGTWGVWPGGVSRPTPKGEVEGSGLGGLQAHTWGVSRPTPRGCIPACTEEQPPMATATGGTHPTGMHSCLLN